MTRRHINIDYDQSQPLLPGLSSWIDDIGPMGAYPLGDCQYKIARIKTIDKPVNSVLPYFYPRYAKCLKFPSIGEIE